MAGRFTFRTLPGLPSEGDPAIGFSPDGRGLHREGLVVEFSSSAENSWVGNFQSGATSFNAVIGHPGEISILVVSMGQGYLVDPEGRALKCVLGPDITNVVVVPILAELLLATFTRLQLVDNNDGATWTTRDVSWDGIDKLEVNERWASGQGWSPIDESWHSFRVDLLSRAVEGGCGLDLPL